MNLQASSVDVWCLRLLDADPPPREFASLLSSEEHLRAAAFHAEAHRRKFILGRGALRFLLGRYLLLNPSNIVFEHGAHGKPFVSKRHNLQFNIAHSGDLALYAFSRLEVGIDIERLRPLSDLMNIARRFFSDAETAELNTLHGETQVRAFHHCWSRKEAYIKALGVGLSLPLESFQVSLLPGEPAALRQIQGQPGIETEWLLLDLPVASDYAAALAVHAPHIDLWTSPILQPEDLAAAISARGI